MEEYEIIETVRKQKDIPISVICGEDISRSAYQRFVKNGTGISVSKFTNMLEKLNLDYSELKIFNYPQTTDSSKRMIKEMAIAFIRQDVSELKRISEFVHIGNERPTEKERHLASLCDLMIARLTNQTVDVTESLIYQYLVNSMTWTRYELILFNNCMYVFNPEFVEIILDKALFSLSMYQITREGKSESFRMLANTIVYFIQNQKRNLAWKYFDKLDAFKLESDMYFEKNLHLFLSGIWHTIRGDEKGKSEVKKSLDVCRYLGAKDQHNMNVQLLLHMEKIWNIDFELEDVETVSN